MSDVPHVAGHAPEVLEKPWGRTRCVFRDETHEVWHASIVAGGFSSRHYHTRKTNEFYVLSGRLLVKEFAAQYLAVPQRVYALPAGTRCAVADHVWHLFEAVEPTELIETYYSHLKGEDIVRHDQGGTA